jgi:hypothetical protein
MDDEPCFDPKWISTVNKFIDEDIEKIANKALKISLKSLYFWPYGLRSLLLAEKGLKIIKKENTGHQFKQTLRIALIISLCEFLAIPIIFLIGILINIFKLIKI